VEPQLYQDYNALKDDERWNQNLLDVEILLTGDEKTRE
jgi:hypothetical protein